MNREYKGGLLAIFVSQMMWGLLPIYWKALVPINSYVIILYRIFLVALVAFIVAKVRYSAAELRAPLHDKRKLFTYLIAGLLITANWSIYIWAINAGYIVQASIGYYIEPLVICLFGIVLFREKLTAYKGVAIALASAAVVLILVYFGELPTIALALAFTFAIYSAIKKVIEEPPLISLLYETIFFAPFAFVAVVYLEINGNGALHAGQPYQYGMLLTCGILTVLPLGFFAVAAQRLPLFIIGVCSYLSPTLQLLVGIFMYGEVVDKVQLLAFAIIWIGLAVFTIGEWRSYKKKEVGLI